MKTAHFHFDAHLAGLVSRRWHKDLPLYPFEGPQSIKHLVEAVGVPHTEVGQVLVDGRQADLGHLVQQGERVDVGSSLCWHGKLRQPRFILDGHLGRLCAGLRMLGFDCTYDAHATDAQLAATSVIQDRVLLSRDRRLLMRRIVRSGYLVRSLLPRVQLQEIADDFRLSRWARPFSRCIRCNELLQTISKQVIVHRLQPLTRRYFRRFRICPSCSQIYWRGSHVSRMEQHIHQVMRAREYQPPIRSVDRPSGRPGKADPRSA